MVRPATALLILVERGAAAARTFCLEWNELQPAATDDASREVLRRCGELEAGLRGAR